MTEREKMLAGRIYRTDDEELQKKIKRAHELCLRYNATYDETVRKAIIKELLPNAAEGTYLEGLIYIDYGENLYIGERVYVNFHFTVLDCCPVTIGHDVFFGPNVSIYPPVHPFLPEQRNLRKNESGEAYDYEYSKPITIGNNCWIAGNVTILGGVTIGDGCVIGAGSVVTRDIPPHSFAAGNPCRVIREITEKDRLEGIPKM